MGNVFSTVATAAPVNSQYDCLSGNGAAEDGRRKRTVRVRGGEATKRRVRYKSE